MSVVGEDVELLCPAVGTPRIVYAWQRGDTVLRSGQDRITILGLEGRLVISAVEETDSDFYNCTVFNDILGVRMVDTTLIQLIVQRMFRPT